MTPDDEEQLAGYFGGELEGAGGLRSWLGQWQDYGPMRGGISSGPSEHALFALAAVRRERVVMRTLERIGREHARILRAVYTPVPATFPDGLEHLGPYRVAACVLEGPDRMRELVCLAREKRPGARRELAAAMARTTAAVRRALDAYELALPETRAQEREGRLERLAWTVGPLT